MTREQAIDEAVRRVDSAWPRSAKLLLQGHGNGEPVSSLGCIACADIVDQIHRQFRRIMREAAP